MVIGLVRAGRFDMVYAVVLLLVNCVPGRCWLWLRLSSFMVSGKSLGFR